MAQPTYGPQPGINQVQQPYKGQNAPNYQQFGGFSGQPQQTFGLTRVEFHYQYYNYPQPNWKLPFFSKFELPNLSNLIQDPIQHDLFWSTIPVKLPSNIPKFDGKQGEYPKKSCDDFAFVVFVEFHYGVGLTPQMEIHHVIFGIFTLFSIKILNVFWIFDQDGRPKWIVLDGIAY